MNNFEKIKHMSIDELAQFIYDCAKDGLTACSYCADCIKTCTYNCETGIKQWLLQECE